jgi:hypothetical protein
MWFYFIDRTDKIWGWRNWNDLYKYLKGEKYRVYLINIGINKFYLLTNNIDRAVILLFYWKWMRVFSHISNIILFIS